MKYSSISGKLANWIFLSNVVFELGCLAFFFDGVTHLSLRQYISTHEYHLVDSFDHYFVIIKSSVDIPVAEDFMRFLIKVKQFKNI